MCIARLIVVYGAFAYIASSSECTTSSPVTPRIDAPRIAWLSASTITFMKPRLSPFSTARPTRVIGRVPTSSRRPERAASACVRPTRASGGSMNIA
ncbi:hypothetical protein DP44_2686 [Burkholderia pseudomallei]|nr:hypothetical protein DP44_2686 [Burkholderia pseudomallei]